jgi:hypothetical protein
VHKGETLKAKEISLEKFNVNAMIFEQTSRRESVDLVHNALDWLKVAADFQPPIFLKRTRVKS